MDVVIDDLHPDRRYRTTGTGDCRRRTDWMVYQAQTTIQFKDVNYANTIRTTTDESGRFSIKVPPF